MYSCLDICAQARVYLKDIQQGANSMNRLWQAWVLPDALPVSASQNANDLQKYDCMLLLLHQAVTVTRICLCLYMSCL